MLAKNLRVIFAFILWTLALTTLEPFSTASYAESLVGLSSSTETKLPSGTTLPRSGEDGAPLVIDDKNVMNYEQYLIAPIVTWVQEGRFQVQAVSQLEFAWDYGSAWRQATRKSIGVMSLDENSNLVWQSSERLERGFPFGFAEALDLETDPERKAQKILWNTSYTLLAVNDQLYSTELAWIGQRGLLRSARGRVFRSYRLKPPIKTAENNQNEALWQEKGEFSGRRDIFFKEAIQFFSPPVVFGLAYITERFRGSRPDTVMVYSPVIGQSRKLLETNRGDGFFDSAVAPSDLFLWSAKPQRYSARVVEEKRLLLPFANLGKATAVYEEVLSESQQGAEKAQTVHGRFQRSDGSETMMLWNHQTRQFAGGAAWIPTEAIFVPRDVWIIELLPKDPFLTTGRELLVVDKESMLPFYRIVYDRSGEYLKTILGSWGLAEPGKDESSKTVDGRRFAYQEFLLAVEGKSSVAVALTNSMARFFGKYNKDFHLEMQKLFDINTHEQLAKQSAEPKLQNEEESDFEERDLDF